MKQLFIFLFLFINISSFAQGITAPAPLTIEANATGVDAGDFVVNWTNNTDNILISLSLDYHSGATLSFPTTTGITRNYGYNLWTGISSIVFYGTKDNINAALAAMTISMGTIKTAVRINIEVSTYDASYFYNPVNKHFYKFISGATTYTNAKSGASGQASFKGKNAYLATITSQSENDFINNNVSYNNIWIALSDATTEGKWILDAGPEANINIWNTTVSGVTNTTYTAYAADGLTVAGQYANWCTSEPNNSDGSRNGEDAAVAKWGGATCWNDLADGNSSGIGGYLVEYSADFPGGSDYSGVYSAYVVHNNDVAFTLSNSNVLGTTNTSNYPNLFGGLQVNDGHTVNVASASKLNANKIILSGTGKIVFTDATSKWMPGTSNNLNNTFIHSPSTNTNPINWSVSSSWNYSTGSSGAGDVFYANAPYPGSGLPLHFTPYLNSPQGWSAQVNNTSQYIILNYDIPAYITGIVTQGRAYNGGQWVNTGNVDVSIDGTNWINVLTNSNFNTNSTDAVIVYFPNVVYAKYVRFVPQTWTNHITMRMGLIIKSNNIVSDGLLLHMDAGNLAAYNGTSTTWYDISGNGNIGTLGSSPTYSMPNKGYLTFNGSVTQVSIADNATMEPGTSDWSMEAWFYSTNTSGSTVILGKVNNGGASSAVSYMIRTSGSNLYAQMGDGTGTYINSTGYTIAANTWYQVLYVWKAGATKTLETFVNGKSIGTVTHTMSSLFNSSNPLYLGIYNGNEYAQSFTGNIGIVRLYKKALSAQDVLTNFNANRSRYGL